MKIIVVREFDRPWRSGNLNMRQLLNPIFYTRQLRHPDMTRQRGRRQRSKDLKVVRRLKTQYVPLCFVDRACYIHSFEHSHWVGYVIEA